MGEAFIAAILLGVVIAIFNPDDRPPVDHASNPCLWFPSQSKCICRETQKEIILSEPKTIEEMYQACKD